MAAKTFNNKVVIRRLGSMPPKLISAHKAQNKSMGPANTSGVSGGDLPLFDGVFVKLQ
jgi:hypothetical protein